MLTAAKTDVPRVKTSVGVNANLQASCSMRICSPLLDFVEVALLRRNAHTNAEHAEMVDE
jgi:hypothetical protein